MGVGPQARGRPPMSAAGRLAVRTGSGYARVMTALHRVMAALTRVALGLSYTALLLVFALGSAGIVAMWAHPPGSPARAELTWAGDRRLGTELDAQQGQLGTIAVEMDRLSVLARGAVGALTADDQGPFTAALTEGSALAVTIESNATGLRADLTALPGAQPADAVSYGSDTIVRRAGLIAALDATVGLRRSWVTLTSTSLQAATLINLLTTHDTTVASAAAEGRATDYAAALGTLNVAIAKLDVAADIRAQLANTTDVSTLDTWIARNRRYDQALQALYKALGDSGGKITDAVRAAYAAEGLARAALPPDTRGLVVIIADIGQGGLNQAVIAIDQARAHLSLALGALST